MLHLVVGLTRVCRGSYAPPAFMRSIAQRFSAATRFRVASQFGLSACSLLLSWSSAHAQDREVRLMHEPTSYTDVIDAFDKGDPFDLHASVGFLRSQTTGNIQRETNETIEGGVTPGDGRSSRNFLDIARHKRVVNSLMLGIDAGIYRDLAAFIRIPVILSDSRSLNLPKGLAAADVNGNLIVPGDPPMPLFELPFRSPTRSGIDYIGIGLAWAMLNQFREPYYPTWVIRGEVRIPGGSPMHACSANTDGPCNGGSGPGISQGVTSLVLETRLSRRFRYLEPYAGILFQIGWPTSSSKFFSPSGDLSGFTNTLPPRTAELTAGVAVIPWENKGRWQRFTFDLRANASYVSEGHGYSPLFDALGTSRAGALATPNVDAMPTAGTIPRQVNFFGLTDMEAHGVLGGRINLEMSVSKYLRFVGGVAVSFVTPYLITSADPCNPAVSAGPGDARAGTCAKGIINPHHRPVIDIPGNRFRVQGEVMVDAYANAVAQF